MHLPRIGAAACVLWLSWAIGANADDWPQILGPNRDGRADGESLAEAWPESGPPAVWQKPVGTGFAGVAVAGSSAVVFHRQGNEEVVEALDAATGNRRWRFASPTSYTATIVEDDGPRCVPIIHDERVITFGAQGLLHCLSLKDGTKLWSRDTHAEFEAPEGYFGAGSSPIVEEESVIVNVGGGRTGAGIVAFSLKDGKTTWKATNELASYSSPVAATVDGERHLIFVTRMSALSLDPATGQVRFQISFGKRGPTVNAASPTVIGDRLFLTSSYGVGAVYGRITDDALDVLWESDEILSSQYTTCIHDQGVLYGIDGRQDVGAATLRCIDPAAKQVRWEKPGFGYATLLLADGKLLVLKTNGELVLAAADAKRYRELGRAELFRSETRALPALAGGRFYARDMHTLKCFDLRKP